MAMKLHADTYTHTRRHVLANAYTAEHTVYPPSDAIQWNARASYVCFCIYLFFSVSFVFQLDVVVFIDGVVALLRTIAILCEFTFSVYFYKLPTSILRAAPRDT